MFTINIIFVIKKKENSSWIKFCNHISKIYEEIIDYLEHIDDNDCVEIKHSDELVTSQNNDSKLSIHQRERKFVLVYSWGIPSIWNIS